MPPGSSVGAATMASIDRLVEGAQEVALPVVAQPERQDARSSPGARVGARADARRGAPGRPARSGRRISSGSSPRPPGRQMPSARTDGRLERVRIAPDRRPSARARRAPSAATSATRREDLLDRTPGIARSCPPGSGRGSRGPELEARSRRRSCRRRRAAPRAAPGRRPAPATTRSPSAVTTSAPTRLSQVKPCDADEPADPAAERQPADPGVDERAAATARPCAGGRVDVLPLRAARGPGDAVARGRRRRSHRRAGRPRARRRPSPWPATLWPPPRTAIGRPRSPAATTAATTSSVDADPDDGRRSSLDHPVERRPGLVVARVGRQ